MVSDIMLVSGDMCNTIYGDISLINGNDEIIQNANNNIYTVYGEMLFHPQLGNDIYNRRLKLAHTDLRLVEDECAKAILQCNKIKSVVLINATRSTKVYGQCNIEYQIKTYDNTILSSMISISLI